jgi:hypothetical protein
VQLRSTVTVDRHSVELRSLCSNITLADPYDRIDWITYTLTYMRAPGPFQYGVARTCVRYEKLDYADNHSVGMRLSRSGTVLLCQTYMLGTRF